MADPIKQPATFTKSIY